MAIDNPPAPTIRKRIGDLLFGKTDPPPTLDETLDGAEQLLIYAAQHGIEIDPSISAVIIKAAEEKSGIWAQANAGAVLSAVAVLAAKVAPVTAESFAACREIARREIRIYTAVAVLLASIIVVLSIASSVTNGLSTSMTANVATANQLAVDLHTQLDSLPTPSPASAPPKKNTVAAAPVVAGPPGALSQLQLFAATMRAIRDETAQLNWFVWGRYQDPTELQAKSAPAPKPHASPTPNPYELSPDLPNYSESLREETNRLTATYQDVREYAKDVQGGVTLWYGAIATILLPMFYALLGACAYLLRLFSKELASGYFSNAYDISARFFVALIGGIIVGLFGGWTAGVSLSPLALAFLVGYAADIFFTFLENSVQSFKPTSK